MKPEDRLAFKMTERLTLLRDVISSVVLDNLSSFKRFTLALTTIKKIMKADNKERKENHKSNSYLFTSWLTTINMVWIDFTEVLRIQQSQKEKKRSTIKSYWGWKLINKLVREWPRPKVMNGKKQLKTRLILLKGKSQIYLLLNVFIKYR